VSYLLAAALKGIGSVTTVANTVTETVVATYTCPANKMKAGRLIRIAVNGVYGTTTGSQILEMRVRWGGVAGVILATNGAQIQNASMTNRGWELTCNVVCVTAGATGTFECQGWFRPSISATAFRGEDLENTATVTVDTTAIKDLVVTVQWTTANAANTISARMYSYELMN
jgi:hypothetical protein